jgi:hypothetical protein
MGCRTAPRPADRETALDRAERRLAAKDFAGAQQSFSLAAQASPHSATPRMGLARVALAAGDAQTALKEVARAEKECTLTPDNAVAIKIVRGHACQKLGRPPATVWSYLYPAYDAGDAETKTDLYRDLVRLSGQLPPATPGLREFLGETQPGSSPSWQRIRARREWDAGGRSTATVPMGKPYRITIHHSSHDATKFGYAARSATATAEIIRGMRNYQVNEKHWEDIAYHFIIDPRGEIWEARPLRFQGAHALGHNEGNIGICLIGNYEIRTPNVAQVKSLKWLVDYTRKKYAIPRNRLYGHEELKATDCPGKNLMRIVAEMRR